MDTAPQPNAARRWLHGKYKTILDVARRVEATAKEKGIDALVCARGELDGGTISVFDKADRTLVRRYQLRAEPESETEFRVGLHMTFTAEEAGSAPAA